ncbi:MAG: hypothetical protein K1X50_10675 [Candidatus Promineofilum sp.]|nr:hypothetical protein [Promineifilum sp.]
MTLIIANISDEDATELAEVLNERFPYEYKSASIAPATESRVTSDGPIDRELLTGVRMFARGYVAALERRRASRR